MSSERLEPYYPQTQDLVLNGRPYLNFVNSSDLQSWSVNNSPKIGLHVKGWQNLHT